MENAPLISVIIPVYKVEEFVERCLRSVRAQTYQNWEALLIDDCGPDASMKIATDYIASVADPRFIILTHEKNKGLSEARNTGIRAAKGKYVFFLDSDDEITPQALEKLAEKAERDGAEMVIGEVACINEAEGWVRDYFPIKIAADEISGNDLIFQAFIADDYPGMSCNKLVLTNFLRQNELYFRAGLLSQDVLWSFQCAFHLQKMAFVREVTYNYYFHSASIIHNRGEKHFNDWIIIANEFQKAYEREQNPVKKRMLKKYILNFKTLTLQLNWKGQQSPQLWKKSYRAYQQLCSMDLQDYLSGEFSRQQKKENFLQNLPADLGLRIFKYRFNR